MVRIECYIRVHVGANVAAIGDMKWHTVGVMYVGGTAMYGMLDGRVCETRPTDNAFKAPQLLVYGLRMPYAYIGGVTVGDAGVPKRTRLSTHPHRYVHAHVQINPYAIVCLSIQRMFTQFNDRW
jgi:hypothetical protein